MKTVFTLRTWGLMLTFLFSMMFTQSWSQKKGTQAKCPGFTARISNGSVLNLCSGSTINLQVTPAVSSYTYQWQQQTTSGGSFANVSGATGTSLAVNAVGAFRVIVSTGSCIDTSGITSIISLAVTGGTITPANTAVLCFGASGGRINGSTVPGADLGFITYSWEQNENNAGWVAIPGASDAGYLVPSLFKQTSFRRVAKDNCGNLAYSNVVTYNLVADLVAGSLAPASQTITRAQAPATITSAVPASGGSGAFTYQWQSSFWERGPYTDIAGATSESYTPGLLDQTFYFRRVVKDNRCGNSVSTSSALVLVTDGILNAGSLALPSNCFFPGNPASNVLTLNAARGGVPPYTITWESSTDNITFTTIPGASGDTYSPGILTASTWFRKKVVDAAGTVAYTPSEVINMITSVLTGGSIKAMANVACLGSSPAQIKSSGSPEGYVGLSYQWQYKNASTGGAWVNITGQIREALFPEPITEKTTFRRLALDRCGNSVRTASSNEIEIDIKPAIDAGDIAPTSQMVRAGQTPLNLNNTEAPSGGTGSFQISWETTDNIAAGTWTTVSGQTGLSYQPPVVSQTTYFRRATMDNGCLATKYTYGVEVFFNTLPPVTGGDLAGSSCVFKSNVPSLITTGPNAPQNGTAPFTYQWESKAASATTWTVIPGATNETYQPPVLSETTQFRRLITDNWGESAYSAPFTINLINAALNPGSIATATTSVCGGNAPGLITEVTPATGGGSITYQWQSRVDGGVYADIAGATASTYQSGAISVRTFFRRVATEECSGIRRSAFSNEVVIDIAVSTTFRAGLVDGPFITCSGTAPGTITSVLDACAGTTRISYQWEALIGGVWQNIAGATSASYTPGPITGSIAYRRRAFNDCGASGYSNSVQIFVYPGIDGGVIGNASQSVCRNAIPQAIRLLSNCHYTDGTITYQWQRATSATGPWTNIAGATSTTFQPGAVTATTYYRLRAISSRCNLGAFSNVAVVFLDPSCRVSGSASNGLAREAGPIAGVVSESNTMTVYPNPLTGNNIDVKVSTKGTTNVTLVNFEGRQMPISVSNSGAGLMRVSAKSTLAKGIYLLTVRDESGSRTEKLIVQ